MSFNGFSEEEVLKQQLNFLTDLLQKHKTQGAYHQKPQLCGVPYGYPSVYSRQKSVKSTNRSSLGTYNPKYHANRSSFKNQFDQTGQVMSRSFTHKPTQLSSFPKPNSGYSAKSNSLWKFNEGHGSVPSLPNSSFKVVRTTGSAQVSNIGREVCVSANNTKVSAGSSISTLEKTHSSEVSAKNTKDAQVNHFLKPTSECVTSETDHQPHEKNVPSKHPKGTKVSYVTCSDCIIEISEYENGELHINQKKLDPSVQDNEDSAIIGNALSPVKLPKSPSPVKIPESPWSDNVCKKDLNKGLSDTVFADSQCRRGSDSVSQKPISDSSTAKGTMNRISVEMGTKLSNTSSSPQSKNVSSLCKFTGSQQPRARNAKYSKVNVSSSKSQNSVAKFVLKNKYSVKKSNIVKCKINSEQKGCTPRLLKHTLAPKAKSQKCLVNYSKRTLLPVGNLNKRPTYASYSNLNSRTQNHTKGTKSSFLLPSYAKTSRKAAVPSAQSVYKVVNKSNPFASKVLKGGKILSKSNPSSLALRKSDHYPNKKWFKFSNGDATSLAQCSSSTEPKSEAKKVLPSSVPRRLPSSELRNVLNTPKIISRHSLQRIVQRKSSTKKPSLNPSPKSFSDSHTAIKKPKTVRLRKTTYKVVNTYANHVSQVVQMIKTKYRTVNKRSASNSHLKWLQEQKQAYSARRAQKSLSHAKRGWTYASVQQRARKLPVMHSKASRKHSLEQKKVLKNIHGVTYKVSKTQIKKSFTPKRIRKSSFTLRNRKNSAIVNVHGTKFQMSPGGKSLKRLGISKDGCKTSPRRIKVGGFTYVQQKEGSGCLVKFPSATQNVASRMLHRSINTVRAAEAKKTLQKNNMFCMFFNRFGRCNKEGNCPYIHDPSKIAVCTRFLRGTCKISGCPFSHEISPGKMAVCSFFLQGNCTNSNCPYRHTSIKPGTKLCKAFVKGYCNKGSECQDAHILACPQFICEGFCEKESCTWPHPRMKNTKKRCDPPEVGQEVKEIKENDTAADNISDQRYFAYEPGVVSDKCVKLAKSVEGTQTNEKIAKVRNKKIAFPKQPEFIPLC